MAYTSWRGVIGVIKPTMRPGSTEEMIRLLPEGIGVIPIFLDVRKGSRQEFKGAIQAYEPKIKELVDQEVDIVMPEGAGPFVMAGFEFEKKIVGQWERKYKRPMVTSCVSQVAAMKALKIKRPVLASYTTGVTNAERDTYFAKAGFNVAGQVVVSLDDFQRAGEMSPHEIYAQIKREVLKVKRPDGILMRGSGWRSLECIDWLEQDLGIPVVHAVTARNWMAQKILRVMQPVHGVGRLLVELP